MARREFYGLILMIIFLFTVACAPQLTPASPVTQSDKPVVEPAARIWEKEWEKLVSEARKEGKVVLSITAGSRVSQPLADGFRNKFGLNVEVLGGIGAEMSQRILMQRRAGIYMVDTIMDGAATIFTLYKPAGAVDSLESALILPDVLDPKVWWGGNLRWLDKDRTLLAFQAAAQQPLVINTNIVNEGEIRSYKDLLNPKWKGKIAVIDPTVVGFGSKWAMVIGLQIMNIDYLRQFATQEPLFSRDNRLLGEWIAHGKYPIGIAIKPDVVKDFQNSGAPLKYVDPEEGTWLSSGGGTIALANRAPHPNAARLFVNWLLTKEGATIFSQSYGTPSARLDVTTDGIDPKGIPKSGVKYFIGDLEEFTLKEPTFYPIAKDIFGPLLQR